VTFEFGFQLQEIGEGAFGAFMGAEIRRITIPRSVKVLGASCFVNCKSLREVIFEDGSQLERIEGWAFTSANFSTIIIPANVIYVGDECFAGNESLKEVIFEPSDKPLKLGKMCYDRCVNLSHIEYGRNNLEICNAQSSLKFSYEKDKIGTEVSGLLSITELAIPSHIKVLDEGCFSHCRNLREVIFDDDSPLSEIRDGAFEYTDICSIRIPAEVEVIGKKCFSGCFKLREVIFEEGSKLREIGDGAFEYAHLETITIPATVEHIGIRCFAGNKSLRGVIFSAGSRLRGIGDLIFAERNKGPIKILGLENLSLVEATEDI
jgi:hypothetical protein